MFLRTILHATEPSAGHNAGGSPFNPGEHNVKWYRTSSSRPHSLHNPRINRSSPRCPHCCRVCHLRSLRPRPPVRRHQAFHSRTQASERRPQHPTRFIDYQSRSLTHKKEPAPILRRGPALETGLLHLLYTLYTFHNQRQCDILTHPLITSSICHKTATRPPDDNPYHLICRVHTCAEGAEYGPSVYSSSSPSFSTV